MTVYGLLADQTEPSPDKVSLQCSTRRE